MNPSQSVIGAITLGGKDAYWRVADILKSEDFPAPWFGDVYRIMGEIARSSVELDIITIITEMERQGVPDPAEVSDCAAHTPGYSAVRTYAELVKKDATERRFRAICAEGAKTGDISTTQSKITALLSSQPAHAVQAADALNRMWKAVMARYEAGDALCGIETGYPLVDEMTGGLQPGRLYGIGARAKMGKTALAMNICVNVACPPLDRDGALMRPAKHVAIWSLEMSDEELMQRMTSSLSGTRSVLLQRPKLLDEEDTAMSKLNVAIKRLRDAPLSICDRMDITVEEIEAQARQMREGNALDLMVVDYLALLRLPKADRHDLAIAHVTRNLKRISKELRVPIIPVFQLNRGNENGQAVRPPRPSDARDSGAIEQDLDAMFLLHRPSYYDKNAPKGLRLDLALQRNGPTGVIHMNDELDCFRFTGGATPWDDKTNVASADYDL